MTNFEKCHFAHCSSAVNTKLQLLHNIVIDDAPPAHNFKTSQLNELNPKSEPAGKWEVC